MFLGAIVTTYWLVVSARIFTDACRAMWNTIKHSKPSSVIQEEVAATGARSHVPLAAVTVIQFSIAALFTRLAIGNGTKFVATFI